MSKKCPKCFEIYDYNHTFCSNCGSRLIDDIDNILNLGDANAISGGININRSNNITSNDTHYHSTLIHERSKSDFELRLEAINQIRTKAEEIISERGRLDSIAIEQIRPLVSQLGIDNEIFKSIIKEVRSNRKGSSISLNTANIRYLQQAKQAVQTNDFEGLSSLLSRLEAMAAISQDDEVQYIYYMALSFLDPIKSIEIYETKEEENYWCSLWVIVSYINTGNFTEATKILTSFNPLRFEKSAEDQTLMEAFFNLMKNDRDTAQDFLDEIIDEPSPQLAPLYRAIESIIYNEEVDNLEESFYLQRITEKKNSTNNPIPQHEISLEEAAEAGSADAMYKLAQRYCSIESTESMQKLGFEWLTKAAELDYTKALDWMGQIYFGCGSFDKLEIKEDLTLAEYYFKKAISCGLEDCRISLASVYERIARRFQLGEDNYRINHTEALKWFDKVINADPSDPYIGMLHKSEIYSDPMSIEYNMELAFNCCNEIIALDKDTYGVFRYKMGLWYASGQGCQKDIDKAMELMTEASHLGHEEAQMWLENNVKNNVCYPQPEINVSFSNMRLINVISKINVRGKLGINFAVGKTFDVTIQWNFFDFDRWFDGAELHTDTITPLYEFTEWKDFDFGLFGFDDIAPHNSPRKNHDGECIIRVHDHETGKIICQTKIECSVEFKDPIFGDRKVHILNYRFNES